MTIRISLSPGYPVAARYAAFRINQAPKEDLVIAYVEPGSVPEVSEPAILCALVAPEGDKLQGILFDLQSAEHVVLRLMRAICDTKHELRVQDAFEASVLSHAQRRYPGATIKPPGDAPAPAMPPVSVYVDGMPQTNLVREIATEVIQCESAKDLVTWLCDRLGVRNNGDLSQLPPDGSEVRP